MAKPAFDPTKPFEPAAKPAFDPSKPFEVVQEPEGPGFAEKFETGARSALEGITLGASEPVISGINAFVGNLISAGFNAEDIGEFAKQAVSSEAIKQEYERDISRRRKLEAELPEVAIPSEIAGGVLGGLATGGAGTAAKALTLPMRAVEGLAGAAGKVVPTAIGSAAARGAVSAAGAEAVKGLAQVPTGVALPEEISVTGAAQFGGLLGGGLTAAGKGIQAAVKGAPKVLSALGGVSTEAIEQYLKDPAALTRAKSPEQIKDSLDNFVDQLQQGVEQGKLSQEQAQKALDAAKSELKDAVEKRTNKFQLAKVETAETLRGAKSELREAVEKRTKEFQLAKFDAAELSRTAQAKLNEAIRTQKEDTKAILTGAKTALRDQTVDAVSALKEKVKAGSAQSYKILEQSGRVVQVQPAKEAAKNALDELKVQGKAPTAGASAEAYKKIQKYLNDLGRYKNLLSTKDAKKKIQQLDQDWLAAVEAGDFTTSEQQALRSIRAAFDEQLKSIPEYAEIMKQVSANTDLLSRANKAFGTLEKAGTKIARIDLPQADLERALLIELGQATERPFEQSITRLKTGGLQLQPGRIEAQLAGEPLGLEAAQVERALKDMARPGALEQAIMPIEQGPLGLKAAQVERTLKAMGRPGALEQAIAPIEQGPLGFAVGEAEQKLAARQIELKQAQQKIKDLGPFARPLSNISAIRTAVTGKNPEYRNFLQSLSQMSGEDFVQYVDDLRLGEAFQKEFRIGSRNVNLWALGSGAAVYGITGDPTSALVVAGLGGGFGGLVDRFGPAMTQKILDGYLKVQGMPTVQKVEAAFAGMPKEVISQMKNDLIRSVSVADKEEVLIDPVEAESVRLDVMTSDLSAVQKAKMVKAIASGKPVQSDDLAAVMLGKKGKPSMYIQKPQKEDLKIDRPDVLKALEQRERQ
jgi:predicted XRE-type DNA-binding protein